MLEEMQQDLDTMLRILLADDQPQVCSALHLLIEHEPGLEVVAEAQDTRELWIQLQKTQPDLVLLDWELPGAAPNELLFALRMYYPHLAVVALSGRLEAHQAAVDAGVDAFISKSYPPEQLLTVLRAT